MCEGGREGGRAFIFSRRGASEHQCNICGEVLGANSYRTVDTEPRRLPRPSLGAPSGPSTRESPALESGGGPDPHLGLAVSSMVLGQRPFFLLVHQFKSGCSVEVIKGNSGHMGKRVEVRWRKFMYP